mgnify:CR=1 FL=1
MSKDYIWYLTDLPKIQKNGYKVFTTFSCGGGSSMGYKLAGYEVLGNCEIDPAINAMYVKNHHPKYNFLMGVQDFYKQNNIPEELFDIDVLDGSPPCSLFSTAGIREDGWGKMKHFREGQAEQILDDLFFEYLNVVEKLHPKVCVAENVKGLILGNAKGYVNLIFKRFKELGYDTQLFLLNAATMGVPQKRERTFFIARRRELCLPPVMLRFNEKPIFYGEFADTQYKPLNQTTMEYKRWLKRSPKDESIGDTVKRTEHGKISRFTSSYLKANRVPSTLIAAGGMVRFDVPGKPSDKDIITIQTFPQDYDFNGNDVSYVCGMSVPPLMMRGVAREVQRQLLDKIQK